MSSKKKGGGGEGRRAGKGNDQKTVIRDRNCYGFTVGLKIFFFFFFFFSNCIQQQQKTNQKKTRGGGGGKKKDNCTCDIRSHSACHHLVTLGAFDVVYCGELRYRKPYK